MPGLTVAFEPPAVSKPEVAIKLTSGLRTVTFKLAAAVSVIVSKSRAKVKLAGTIILSVVSRSIVMSESTAPKTVGGLRDSEASCIVSAMTSAVAELTAMCQFLQLKI
jgi:hypothetical protein